MITYSGDILKSTNTMYAYRNLEARSCNKCCRGKPVKYYIFCVRVCSLSYPTCNAHAPNFRLRPVRLHNVIPYYLTNGTIFEKNKKNNLLNTEPVLIFSKS